MGKDEKRKEKMKKPWPNFLTRADLLLAFCHPSSPGPQIISRRHVRRLAHAPKYSHQRELNIEPLREYIPSFHLSIPVQEIPAALFDPRHRIMLDYTQSASKRMLRLSSADNLSY